MRRKIKGGGPTVHPQTKYHSHMLATLSLFFWGVASVIGDSANPNRLLLLPFSTPFAICCTEEYTKYNHIILSLTPSDSVHPGVSGAVVSNQQASMGDLSVARPPRRSRQSRIKVDGEWRHPASTLIGRSGAIPFVQHSVSVPGRYSARPALRNRGAT